ncbi:DNA-binding proteins Bright/BRCAA1/RBP1 and related proteins containing BRIGHT domain-containing protein [Scheffersomyces stipitis CBS 6054]|uniref:DNA-binding proteins Bright/BRCAA1/RBP1 and related proteins containing BRIGHT domain-containing protein n=1 Tax=Scheffersomyces stipitis (strain ATCC 58785 / CBS 6054 / NBRC 10063 / NRRL Y-11545) TaxID=322104 RepID=A3GGP6_PICST|nr:DNA-binding proteins Bright/BRCAA1/RBP1 and related proteins containing BRIGHT domain-containing protein [Scheffersomyces stipitis CBS 6054]EAZ63566.2 DNA-binding proteins Bright/BRCAA1/RBP1 and related proteins containing BRIGHT domain-containing protein [Scheffersomyces stipitis CBS 6054]
MASGYYNDHYGSLSSEPSGPSSPHVLKPSALPSHRQRSSSINSLSSNHSHKESSHATNTNVSTPLSNSNSHNTTNNASNNASNANYTPTNANNNNTINNNTINTSSINNNTTTSITSAGIAAVLATPNTVRSMSIVSLESPRNSIVSLGDDFIRPTRNNSTTSLASLNSQSTAINNNSNGLPNDYVIAHRLRHHINTSSAILSDDDSELETTHRTILKPRLRRDTKPDLVLPLNRDFKFKYDSSGAGYSLGSASNGSGATTTPSSPSAAPAEGSSLNPTRSPPLLTINPALRLLQDPTPSPLSLTKLDLLTKEHHQVALEQDKVSKKSKVNSLMQSSLFLKKKLILSKDLQLELMHNTNSPSSTQTSLKPSQVSTLAPVSSELMNAKFLTANTTATGKKTYSNSPVMETLVERNKRIHELNQKWNRSISAEATSTKKVDKKNDNLKEEHAKSEAKQVTNERKRSRTYSFDDDDDYDPYDPYDDYDTFGTYS